MVLLNIIRAILVLMVVPMFLGIPVVSLMGIYEDRRVYRFFLSFTIGYLITFAIMQIISVPLILNYKSLTSFVLLYSVIVCVCGIILNAYAYIFSRKNNTKVLTKNFIRRIILGFKRVPNWVWIILIGAILLFLFMEYHYLFRIHVDDDDGRYMGNPANAVLTDTMYQYDWGTGKYIDNRYINMSPRDLVSPWMMMFALLSRLIGVNSTIIAHSIMPGILFAICFMEYFLMGDCFFKKDKAKTVIFLFMVCVVYLTFSGNTHTQAAVSLVRIWQGKAAFATTIIPLMMYLYLMLSGEEVHRARYYILGMITSCAGCFMSGVGIVGTGLFMGPFFFWDIVSKRKWKDLFWLIIVCIPTLIYGYMYAKIK
ncbi:MAG: hypothetical protein K5851_06985 [Lachnospiraceae bacterium]|nr:hypothetical protein [Lachnospiraceae bacterium]